MLNGCLNEKLRLSLVLYHDMDVALLIVAYISSMVLANPGLYDIVIPLGTPISARAGSIYKSVVRVCWIAMVKRILVIRKLGEAD